MSIVLNSLLPIFGLMLLGAISKKFNILGDNSSKVISRFVLFFSLPAILFVTIAEASKDELLNIPFFSSMVIVMFLFYIGVFLFCRFYKRPANESLLLALSIAFPNTAFMGIPVLLSLFGEISLIPLAIANLVATLIFCLTVLLLEITEDDNREKNLLKKIIKVLLTQPLLIAIVLGIIASLVEFRLPKAASAFLHQLGSTCGPCAMFILGEKILDLKFNSLKKRYIKLGLIAKLIIMPIIAYLILNILNVSPIWAASGILLMGLPAASTPYMLAIEKNICSEESSELIIISTAFSLITLGIIIFLMTKNSAISSLLI